MRSLLIHADDFGMSQGVVEGILASMTRGVVTATSAMVCEAEYRERVARSAGPLAGRVGIHLQLTDGVPLTNPARVPTLVDEAGRFPRRREQLGDLDPREILAEWRAQLDTLRSLGVEPSHINTHHNVHTLPAVVDAYVRFALETSLPARGWDLNLNRYIRGRGVACPDVYVCPWQGRPVKAAYLERTLRALTPVVPEGGMLEVACHPARVDEELARRSVYSAQRADELEVLCLPELPEAIRELGYRLAGPSELRPRD